MKLKWIPNLKLSLKLELLSKRDLYAVYMPFIKEGGMFIRTEDTFELGDVIQLSIKLLDDAEVYVLKTKIVWLTPKFAQGNLPQGIGVQFTGEDARKVRDRIENYLAGFSQQEATDTM